MYPLGEKNKAFILLWQSDKKNLTKVSQPNKCYKACQLEAIILMVINIYCKINSCSFLSNPVSTKQNHQQLDKISDLSFFND